MGEGGLGMKTRRISCFLTLLLIVGLGDITTQAARKADRSPERDGLFIDNARRMLLKYELLDKLDINGLSRNGEEVDVTAKEGVELKALLKGNPQFTADMFPTGWSHEGCDWSYRSRSSPSLQITHYPNNRVEVDIDRWCPRWADLKATGQHIYEISSHKVMRWLRKPINTSQRAIAKALNKQKYPVLVSRQARVFHFNNTYELLIYNQGLANGIELIK